MAVSNAGALPARRRAGRARLLGFLPPLAPIHQARVGANQRVVLRARHSLPCAAILNPPTHTKHPSTHQVWVIINQGVTWRAGRRREAVSPRRDAVCHGGQLGAQAGAGEETGRHDEKIEETLVALG